MGTHRSRRSKPQGFTLIELLVVVLIVVLVGAATIKVAIFDQGGRRVSEAARMLQASLVGARDAAFRANAPRGIRLLPDPNFNGLNGGALAANRMISIGAAPDYNSGLANVTVLPTVIGTLPDGTSTTATGSLQVNEAVFTKVGSAFTPIPNEPTSWYWNIRQGEKIRFGDSGRYYTIAGPTVVGAYDSTQTPPVPVNVERYINNGKQGTWYTGGTYDPNPMSANHPAEFLYVVNGQDDDGDGWVDEGFDGIDNDGDGIIDPGFNGLDDNNNGIIDEPAELLLSYNQAQTQKGYYGGEYEPEQFVGSEFNSVTMAAAPTAAFGPTTDKVYTILRRPVVTEGAREVMLPEGVVIDLTTWNALSAINQQTGKSAGTLPERSRVPIDPYSFYVDVMIGPDGQVQTASAGTSAGASAGGGSTANFPTSNMPFYHFWICEREDVYDPMFGLTTSNVPQAQVPYSNTLNNGTNTPPKLNVNLLPMPQGTSGLWFPPNGGLPIPQSYNAPQANGPYLKGDMRLVTLFVKTGQVLTYDLGLSDFDPTDVNQPYMQAQFGVREAK